MRAAATVIALALVFAGTAAARTIVGTSKNDRLLGTPRADTLLGREGKDRLIGGAGSDFLIGGPGRDLMEAGGGGDRVVAQYDGANDTVRCGPGADIVNADLADKVAADCELVGRRISRDPYRDAEAQHETEVEPDSLTVGSTTVATFQVGRRFDGGATNIGFAVSTDDGRSWRSGLLPGLTQASQPAGIHPRASDPVVAYDASNRVWLISTLGIDRLTTRLPISRSLDGVSWSAPVVAAEETVAQGVAFDKNWLACDNGAASPFLGRCYLVYTHSSDGEVLSAQHTTDGGLTWSPPVDLPAAPAVGAFPVIRPNGDLVVVFTLETQPHEIAASRSTDGGMTFGTAVRIADVAPSACGIRGLRGFPLPSADVDPAGRVWVTWHDCSGSPRFPDNNVLVATSDDGVTWAAPAIVTSERNAILPAIGIHVETGRVALAYYAVRPGGIDAELIESEVGGSGWRPPRRLSAQTMPFAWMPNTALGRMLADYISVHYAGTRPLVVWALASEPVGASFRQAIYATRG